jgi:hypothetical protein
MSVFASYAICKVAKDAAGIAGNCFSLSLTFPDSELSQIFLLIFKKNTLSYLGFFYLKKKNSFSYLGFFFI